MYQLPRNIDQYLAALSKLFELNGNRELQEIIVNANIRVHEEWSHDNWNGGNTGHALYLTLPEQLFLQSVPEKDAIQLTIRKNINDVHNVQNEFVEEVFLEMEVADDRDWRQESGLLLNGKRPVSDEARRRLWTDDAFRLFLSHKSEFREQTATLKEQLAQFGISCFVAHQDIRPTQAWIEEIENALNTMDGFAALMTPDFHESDWTDQEVGFAFARGVPRIAVMLGRAPYGFMGKFQGLKSTWENAATDMAGVLIKNDRMFSVYLSELRKCPNWNHANVLGSLLPKIVSLSEEQIDQFVATYNETSELRGAFAFDGTKPTAYGPGIASHLNRLGPRKYKLGYANKLEIVSSQVVA